MITKLLSKPDSNAIDHGAPLAVERCDRFVGRTVNWLYDHLRFVPRYKAIVVCDLLENRREFPEMTAVRFDRNSLARGMWRRISGRDANPFAVRFLRQGTPRVLHSHFGYVAVDDFGLWKSLGVPWVIAFYGADIYALGQRLEWRQQYKQIFSVCQRVLALGPTMARHLEQLGCPTQKILIHPLGINVASLPELPRHYTPGGPLKILFAGTFREKKGLHYALQAVADVRKAGCAVQLELVGEASEKPGDRETKTATLQLIKDLGLEDVVVRHSFITFGKLLSLSLNCHVFLAPSVTAADGDAEGTPFVLQQMMATAMPTIATHHSDIPFLFGDLSYLLIAERDSNGIADRLLSYAGNPNLLLEHGYLFRKRMLEHFDVRMCARKLSDLYDALI